MNSKISRQIARAAARKDYDIIIVGGGIYGAMLLLESSMRGLKSLLLEQKDFGSATSFNSLRIVHGGLRYLQSLDLPRFFESVGERRHFLREFPELVEPLPCLMPLYGEGLRRRIVLRAALSANDILSAHRNAGVLAKNRIRQGKTIDAAQAKALFPDVRSDGLKAAAIWYDACVPDSQRLVIEILRRSCELGATALNYVRGDSVLRDSTHVRGVQAVDVPSGDTVEFNADVVVNAAGPWCRQLAAEFDQDNADLFQSSSVAWNVLFNREALSAYALAIAPPHARAQVYFAYPWKNRLLVGTGYAPWYGGPSDPMPSKAQLGGFIDALNAAVPGLNLKPADVQHVFAGLLPGKIGDATELADRAQVFDHSSRGGPQGLYSVSGVKMTTARRVAEKTLQRVFPRRADAGIVRSPDRTSGSEQKRLVQLAQDALLANDDERLAGALEKLVSEESVLHLDDLILRRTTLWEHPQRVLQSKALLLDLFDWDESRQHQEIAGLEHVLQQSRCADAN